MRLLKITVVTSSFSRAWVHRLWIVYIAEPSACRLITRRPGAATAAPVEIGMPPPIAPPVTVSQSCGAAPCVAPTKARPNVTASFTMIAWSGIIAVSDCAKASLLIAPFATSTVP